MGMGFLPFKTSPGEKVFLSIVSFIAICFLWLRFVELYVSMWGAPIVSAIVAAIIIKWG